MRTFLCCMLLLAGHCHTALAAYNVSPTGSGGNSSLVAPFSTSSSLRFQQVYRAGSFRGAGAGEGYLIHEIHFALDEALGVPFEATFPDFQINFSITPRGPDELSSTFSQNIGVGETVVFGRGSLHIAAGRTGFGAQIRLQHPFLYDPAVGNLLVDFWNFAPGNGTALDAFDRVGDQVSVVTGTADAVQGSPFTRGLATEFWADFVVIPEPSTTLLLALGLLAISWRFRQPLSRRRSRTNTHGTA